MEADFSGWASKNNLLCDDGRTITDKAFVEADQQRVPLLWHHLHDDPENVLGHAILEHRPEGTYAYGFFNDTERAQHIKQAVKHGDVNALSIFANKLVHKGKSVVHGVIRELSLVLAGANPGAMIENVNLAHGNGSEVIEDEAIIYTGLLLTDAEIKGEDDGDESVDDVALFDKGIEDADEEATSEEIKPEDAEEVLTHAATDTEKGADVADVKEKTIQDVLDTLNEEQSDVVNYLVGEALGGADSDGDDDSSEDKNDDKNDNLKHSKEGSSMGRNVFDQTTTDEGKAQATSLSHDAIGLIVADAKKNGSFKDAFLAHAGTYGIDDIDVLFPDAKTVTSSPEVIGRRTEWVASVIGGSKHSPFSRIKSTAVDLTADEARAKGYVKATLKKEEVIRLLKRVTTPTTVYKKQKLDRDDILDITDLDVVSWLKAEMRVMLDEEIARAILIGDGREPDDEDKINEEHVRPIAFDDDMYAHQITVPANIDPDGIVESVLRARTHYKGTGTPTFYTTDQILTDLILIKDKIGRRLYNNEADLAAALRVAKIVVVEVMESIPNLLGIMVNIADYTIGSDRGGSVSMFDDFDIDYNQYKYLIESRISGALTKPKSAVVIKRVAGNVVTAAVPTYNPTTHVITIPTVAGVAYYIGDDVKTGTVTITETTEVEARPTTGYSFNHNTDNDWTFAYTN